MTLIFFVLLVFVSCVGNLVLLLLIVKQKLYKVQYLLLYLQYLNIYTSKYLLSPAGEHQPVRGAGGGGAPGPGGGRAPPDPRHQAAAQLGHGPDALLHHTCHHGK